MIRYAFWNRIKRYIGKLFSAYIDEQIDYSQILKCVHAVELSDIDSRDKQYRDDPKFSKVGKIYTSINDTGKNLQNVLKTYL